VAKDLTVKAIETMRPGATRREVPDGHTRGLFYVLQPSGAASWAYRYRFAGKPKKLTIGSYPAIDIRAARELASEAAKAVARGDDPASTKKAGAASVRAMAAADRNLVEKVVERFVEKHVRPRMRPASQREVERLLRVEIIPKLGKRPFADVTRGDVRRMVEDIADRPAPIVANRTLSLFRLLCNWARAQEIIQSSPVEGLKPPAPERSRDRILTDDEIQAFWRACEEIRWPFGPLAQLLLLTGARRDEVGGMKWSEIDLPSATWRLTGERVKNAREHNIPLSPQAVRILESLPRIGDAKGFIFSTNGETPVSGFSKAKTRLDEEMAKATREANSAADEIPHWTFHDLRRTCASGMASLRIAPHVIEAVLNHASGAIKGVAAVYNRYRYDDEKRAALEAWGRYVETLMGGEPAGNVGELASARA